MSALVPPHGGLTEPVSRTVLADDIPNFLARAKTLVHVPVSDADLSTVYRFGDGGLSRRIADRTQRPEIRLDHPALAAGDGRDGQKIEAGQKGRAGEFRRPNRGRLGHHRHILLGQNALPPLRLSY